MFRKFTPYLLTALLALVAVVVWRTTQPAHVEHVATPVPRTQNVREAAPPSRLDFLKDTSQPYQARISILRNTLATECSELELRALYQLLEQGPPTGELSEHWFVIANDLMIQILAHETDSQRFAQNFTRLLGDTRQPEVIRDYAVQYLVSWINPQSTQPTASKIAQPSPEITSQVLQSLAATASDPSLAQSTIPGTTLMMLTDLSRSSSEVDCSMAINTLKPWISQTLQDGSSVAPATRVSAVTAAAALAPDEFRPLLRQIAFQEYQAPSLRLPAIAALGQAGEQQDLGNLRLIANSSSPLKYAAQEASTALSARFPSTSSLPSAP